MIPRSDGLQWPPWWSPVTTGHSWLLEAVRTNWNTNTIQTPHILPAATWFSPQSLVKGDPNVSGDKLRFSKRWLRIRLWGVMSGSVPLWICMIPRPDGTAQLQGIQCCGVWRQCMFLMMDHANYVMLKVCDISTALLIRLCTFYHFPILDVLNVVAGKNIWGVSDSLMMSFSLLYQYLTNIERGLVTACIMCFIKDLQIAWVII